MIYYFRESNNSYLIKEEIVMDTNNIKTANDFINAVNNDLEGVFNHFFGDIMEEGERLGVIPKVHDEETKNKNNKR